MLFRIMTVWTDTDTGERFPRTHEREAESMEAAIAAERRHNESRDMNGCRFDIESAQRITAPPVRTDAQIREENDAIVAGLERDDWPAIANRLLDMVERS